MTDNFYAAPQAELELPPRLPADLRSNKATRGSRLGAVLIDSVILFALVLVTALAAGLGRGVGKGLVPALPGVIVFGIFGLALLIGNIVLLSRFGQTLGKRAMGIAIVRTDGSRCDLWRILVLRIFLVRVIAFVPFVGVIFSLVDMLVIFGEERRCIHDYMADTIVVHT
ncbi:putative RDD family membrane protein YckC [Luteibacter sp. OK325]|jgi:uncharacterized RDD family membrane protein YckC|uniref:RDD family protein n=1 Tax=Luteibacter sp. OK325 TaxID=2135670 RepID=UPI000D37B964|nr:RDD family protein [Luteibacter sp. OK325]PTR32919.1 putative RDD family membrane protein YckC [Luteibacter sp. OK325]